VIDLQKILTDIRNGDKTAFETLYESYKTPLFTIIYRITRNFEVSEDILQEMFIKIYTYPPEPLKNPRAYLFKMAHNIAIDNLRKQKEKIDLTEAENQAPLSQPDYSIKIDIENALATLPDRDCQIVTLHINGDLKFREIAEILKLPLGTVLWAYQKSIKQLRTLLGSEL